MFGKSGQTVEFVEVIVKRSVCDDDDDDRGHQHVVSHPDVSLSVARAR